MHSNVITYYFINSYLLLLENTSYYFQSCYLEIAELYKTSNCLDAAVAKLKSNKYLEAFLIVIKCFT